MDMSNRHMAMHIDDVFRSIFRFIHESKKNSKLQFLIDGSPNFDRQEHEPTESPSKSAF